MKRRVNDTEVLLFGGADAVLPHTAEVTIDRYQGHGRGGQALSARQGIIVRTDQPTQSGCDQEHHSCNIRQCVVVDWAVVEFISDVIAEGAEFIE